MSEPWPPLPTVYAIAYNAAYAGILKTVNFVSSLAGYVPGENKQVISATQAAPNNQYPTVMMTSSFVQGLPTYQGNTATYSIDFTQTGVNISALTVSRASAGTDLLASAASGAAYNTFVANQARVTPGVGLLIEESRTNYLLNSTAPATQTTGTLPTSEYTLWVNGAGSAAVTAGTATITGGGTATNGSPNTFNVTVTGTVTITVTGLLNAFQLEAVPLAANAPTSLIITAGATATRAADAVSIAIAGATNQQTLYASGIPYMPSTYSNQVLVSTDLDTNDEWLIFRGNGSTTAASLSIIGGVSTTITDTVDAWPAAGFLKMAASISVGVGNFVFNNGSIYTGTPAGGPPLCTSIVFGNYNSATHYWNGYVCKVAWYASTIFTGAQLQKMTVAGGS